MMPLDTFKTAFKQLDRDHLELLEEIYAEDILFTDPAHSLSGLSALKKYFFELYQNIDSLSFEFGDELSDTHQATLEWIMTFNHPRLAKGRPISVSGCSWLKFNAAGKAIYHHDYFDLGAMLYEQLPLLGGLVRTIKRKLGT